LEHRLDAATAASTADAGPLWATDEGELSSWVLEWSQWLGNVAVGVSGTDSVVETVTAPPGAVLCVRGEETGFPLVDSEVSSSP
jgi:hypothetical protein